MPEHPEVSLATQAIKPLIINKTISNIFVGNTSRYKNTLPNNFNNFKTTNNQVLNVQNKGKFQYWTFDNNWYMFCTFGMTGQYSPKPGKHLCLGIEFNDDTGIYFNDPRHFGTISFTNKRQDLTSKLNDLGWDPVLMSLDKNFNWIKSQFKNKTLAETLMNQKIFCGVGNYIKAESLYRAKLSPWKIANTLTEADIYLLCNSVIDVITESYNAQGATISTYKTILGENGQYSSCFKVYKQLKDQLGNPIISETTPDKRTTWWCPNIQKG
jgi:formamidopyrimidine-DNA glycosylase